MEDIAFVRSHYITMDEARFFFEPEIRALLTNVHKECETYLEMVAEQEAMHPEADPQAWREKASHRAQLREMGANLPKSF